MVITNKLSNRSRAMLIQAGAWQVFRMSLTNNRGTDHSIGFLSADLTADTIEKSLNGQAHNGAQMFSIVDRENRAVFFATDYSRPECYSVNSLDDSD